MDYQFLSRTALFQGSEPDKVKEMMKCFYAREKHYRKGEIIYSREQFERAVGILLSGGASVLKGRGVVLNTEKNELFSCEAAGYDTSTTGFAAMVPVLGEPVTPLRRYYSDSRMRTMRVLRANYLATINDLPKAVEKTADKTMKVIYTLRRGA